MREAITDKLSVEKVHRTFPAKRMAMVDAMPIPDSRQKVDELFLFWLSEPSTQEMLRKKLTKVCRFGKDLTEGGDSPFISTLAQPTLTDIQRPNSPNYRTPSPPLHLSNSPKSPRMKRRSKSPRRKNLQGGVVRNALDSGADEIDYFPSATGSLPLPSEQENKTNTPEKESCKQTEPNRTPAEGAHQVVGNESSTPTEVIPQFFFPNGQLEAAQEGVDEQLGAAAKVFEEQPNGEMTQGNFHLVVKVITALLYFLCTFDS